jgi:Transposase IS4
VHGVEWRRKTVLEPIGGVVARRTWSVRSITGDLIFEGGNAIRGDNRRRPYVYFMAIFPPDALMRIVMLTSEKIREKGKQVTAGGEILKFFGILILGTRYGLALAPTCGPPPLATPSSTSGVWEEDWHASR